MTKAEQAHLLRIKNLPCCVCGASAPSDAHHVTECGRRVGHFATVPLCRECHNQVPNGPMWKVMKMTEWDAMEKTNRMLMEGV